MAEICVCCNKATSFFNKPRKLVKDSPDIICEDCFLKFSSLYPQSKEDFLTNHDEIVKIANEKFSEQGKIYIGKFLKQRGKELDIDDVEEALEKYKTEIEEQKSKIICPVTTGYNFEGYTIKEYKKIISGETVLGTGFLSEFTSSFSDLFGTESNMFSEKLRTAKELALDKLMKNAIECGGNAVIGVDFDYINFSANLIGVVANGTSVCIEKIEECKEQE